jgi:hypothetical protein
MTVTGWVPKSVRRSCMKSCCESCGAATGLGLHHKDGDRMNNSPENLQTLCASCHTAIHWESGKRPWKRLGLCNVCGKPARKLGLCETHHTRLKRHGSPYLVKRKIGSSWRLVEEAHGIASGPEYRG